MSRFAPVAPPRILKEMKRFGPYHLLLAHDILANPEEYGFFLHRAWIGTIILDNSITELGTAVDVDTISRAANICDATVIVLPDVYHDCEGTIRDCRAALESWPSSLTEKRDGYMIVPQGNTIWEFAKCAEAFKDDKSITWWGIPRNLTAKLGTRAQSVQICHTLNPSRSIHLLGFSDNIVDDILCAQSPQVSGIDSAVPIRAASLGMQMSMTLKMPKRGDWFETATHVPLMDDNLNTVIEWINRRGL